MPMDETAVRLIRYRNKGCVLMKPGNIQILDQFGRPFSSRSIYKSGNYDDGFRCAIRGPGAASIKCEPLDASTARLAWSPLKAGNHSYDLFLTGLDGVERPLIKGEIQADPRVTPPSKGDVVIIGEIEIIIPAAVDGEVRIIDAASGAAERAEAVAKDAVTARN